MEFFLFYSFTHMGKEAKSCRAKKKLIRNRWRRELGFINSFSKLLFVSSKLRNAVIGPNMICLRLPALNGLSIKSCVHVFVTFICFT